MGDKTKEQIINNLKKRIRYINDYRIVCEECQEKWAIMEKIVRKQIEESK